MNTITYAELKTLVDQEVGFPVNTCLLWGTQPITVYPADKEMVFFRLFTNLRRKSTRPKMHKKDNGHTVTINDVRPLILHFTKMKKLSLGAYKVVP